MITFIGDVHRAFPQLKELKDRHPERTYIQVGDVCIAERKHWYPTRFSPNFHFIHGNHDDPFQCAKHPNYLGKYGFNEELDLGFISGAASVIDIMWRKPGIDWWPEEELGYADSSGAIDLMTEKKPRIMVSHDGPHSVISSLFPERHFEPNHTTKLLDAVLEKHQPEYWFFGHHHTNAILKIGKTTFVCLGIMSSMSLDDDFELTMS